MIELMAGATHHIPESRCLNCGARSSAASSLDVERRPIPGDPIACICCGAIMTCDESGALRPFTEPEFAELEADHELMDSLRRAVGNIRLIHASIN